MKLVTFQPKESGPARFGYVESGLVFAFPEIPTAADYLKHFPRSADEARSVVIRGAGIHEMRVEDVRLLAPIPLPPMLLDFSLAPRHLVQSFKTLIAHEYSMPAKRWLMKWMMARNARKKSRLGMLEYYRANHFAVSGPGDEIDWPDYTSYLDLEAELACVIGNREHPILGYLIMNDWSARDVQMPELFSLSLTRSKDFAKSYGLGPYLVTPDEIENPMALEAEVFVSDRFHWRGSTCEYSRTPMEAIQYLRSIFEPHCGTIFGMGTIPGCCGLEHDLWVEPGDTVKIRIQGLGELEQKLPRKVINRKCSRWK